MHFSVCGDHESRQMSLKGKIEAVIYASEEPVTLAQLVGLLGQEAQIELDRLDERQGTLGIDGGEAEETPAPVEEAAVEETQVSEASSEAPEPEVMRDDSADRKALRERERRLREFFRSLLDQLIREYQVGDRGLEIREIAGGFRMGTKPEYHDAVRGFVRSLKPPLRLSLQALETLAVVAYKQPVTAPEVSEIRGVDSGGVLGSLMTRKLVTTAGRKQVIGRPILYKTTKDFLLRFGLKDVSELPSIEEFEKLAGELVEQEEMALPDDAGRGQTMADDEMVHAVEPQADGDTEELNATQDFGDRLSSDEVVEVLDDSNLPPDHVPTLDGRESGLPPTYDAVEDGSAEDAAIQSGEAGSGRE